MILAPLLYASTAVAVQAPAQIAVQGYEIKAAYPHDPTAFTQGLFFRDGFLFESTGQEGESTIRKVRLSDGKVLQKASIPADQFGEGSTYWGNEIISLTWRHGVAHRWDAATFKRKGSFRYAGEGWGLTQNGTHLILSDGTHTIRFLDPKTFKEIRKLQVTARGKPLSQLNELEWVKGEIFANVWMTNFIVRIDPATGVVKGLIDLRGLESAARPGDTDSVLNGIAYDAKGDRLFVTGKRWSKLYEIKLKDK